MSAGSLLQTIIMFSVVMIMMVVMLPVMSSTMNVLSTQPGFNSSDSVQLTSTINIFSQFMPIMIAASFILAFIGVVSGWFRAAEAELPTGSTSRIRDEVDTSRQLESAARRTRTQLERQNELSNRAARNSQPQTRRQELMELDASALAPQKVPAEVDNTVIPAETPQPIIEKPGKSRWESLE